MTVNNVEKHQYDIILNSIVDGVFTIDLNNTITFFNQAAQNITGISREQAVGKKCFDIFRANICQSACALKCTLKSGEDIKNLHINILNAHGRIVPLSASTSVLRDTNGKITGGVEIFRDLSDLETLRKEIHDKYTFKDIISKNHDLLEILDILPDISTSGSTVLLEGPSGSGKELFAKAIHTLSGRKGKYVALNCAALPDSLLESELFGHVKGAFTDAKNNKAGRFSLAQDGTIFLDEIGDMSPALQVKLLRVLQEKVYEPLGAEKSIKADVRIIAATNKSLSKLVTEGSFRNDLYYRINVVMLPLPPLSSRREDIPLLVVHFIEKFNTIKRKTIEKVSDSTMDILMNYDFPGNIRELENFIEHAFVLCHGPEIQVKHLPQELKLKVINNPNTNSGIEINPLDNAEQNTIKEALNKYGNNRQKVADFLGINKTTLWRKMKKYGMM